MANGLWFHCRGRTAGFLGRRTESFQTERGMRMALGRAGFENLLFSRATGPLGSKFLVEAKCCSGATRNRDTKYSVPTPVPARLS
jgi:hypothetical protein